MQGKIDTIQLQAFDKLDSEKEVVMQQMNTKKNEMVSRVDQERPKIEYYDSLPTGIQTIVRKQAETVLVNELANNKD